MLPKLFLNKSLAHPKEVLASAIKDRAEAFLCAHKYSGDPEPSREELRIMKRLVEFGKLKGIPVLDNVIVSDGNYSSFADKGLL